MSNKIETHSAGAETPAARTKLYACATETMRAGPNATHVRHLGLPLNDGMQTGDPFREMNSTFSDVIACHDHSGLKAFGVPLLSGKNIALIYHPDGEGQVIDDIDDAGAGAFFAEYEARKDQIRELATAYWCGEGEVLTIVGRWQPPVDDQPGIMMFYQMVSSTIDGEVTVPFQGAIFPWTKGASLNVQQLFLSGSEVDDFAQFAGYASGDAKWADPMLSGLASRAVFEGMLWWVQVIPSTMFSLRFFKTLPPEYADVLPVRDGWSPRPA